MLPLFVIYDFDSGFDKFITNMSMMIMNITVVIMIFQKIITLILIINLFECLYVCVLTALRE